MVEKALARPDMDFKLDWNKGIGFESKHYEKLRAISRILAAESIVDTIEGNQQKALHYIELNMKLEGMLKDEYTDTGQLIRYSCISVNDLQSNVMLHNLV